MGREGSRAKAPRSFHQGGALAWEEAGLGRLCPSAPGARGRPRLPVACVSPPGAGVAPGCELGLVKLRLPNRPARPDGPPVVTIQALGHWGRHTRRSQARSGDVHSGQAWLWLWVVPVVRSPRRGPLCGATQTLVELGLLEARPEGHCTRRPAPGFGRPGPGQLPFISLSSPLRRCSGQGVVHSFNSFIHRLLTEQLPGAGRRFRH